MCICFVVMHLIIFCLSVHKLKDSVCKYTELILDYVLISCVKLCWFGEIHVVCKERYKV